MFWSLDRLLDGWNNALIGWTMNCFTPHWWISLHTIVLRLKLAQHSKCTCLSHCARTDHCTQPWWTFCQCFFEAFKADLTLILHMTLIDWKKHILYQTLPPVSWHPGLLNKVSSHHEHQQSSRGNGSICNVHASRKRRNNICHCYVAHSHNVRVWMSDTNAYRSLAKVNFISKDLQVMSNIFWSVSILQHESKCTV